MTEILKTRGEIPIKKGFSIAPKNYYVYLHIKEDDGTVFYIGKGTKLRWCVSHSRNLHWKNTAKKHGVVCEIVAHNLTAEESLILEKKLIATYGRQDKKTGCLVNLTDGGDGVVNYVWTEEHRKKISEAGMGRKHTEEFKQMVSRIHTGKTLSQETKDKIASKRRGVKWTESQRLAAESKVDPRSRAVICIDTGTIYKNISTAAKELSLDSSGVSKVCYGKRKQYNNLRFKFVDQLSGVGGINGTSSSAASDDTSSMNMDNAA